MLWFSAIKLQLSGDVVTNLQLQIDGLRDDVNNVLTDSTKALYGLDKNGTPDDIFQFLYETSFKGHAFIKVRIESSNGILMRGIPINITKASGNITNDVLTDGTKNYMVNANESVTVSIPQALIDISGSKTITAPSTGVYTLTLVPSLINFISVSSTKLVQFSNLVEHVDYTLCGGGGGGATGGNLRINEYQNATSVDYDTAGGGGGGGYVASGIKSDIVPFQSYTISVGSGGSGGYESEQIGANYKPTSGGTGGASSIFGTTANGGLGGSFGILTYSGINYKI